MKCLNPVFVGWILGRDKSTGVCRLVRSGSRQASNLWRDDAPNALYVPCGKCPLCVKSKRRDMAVRIYHESLKYDENCFITLTYNDEHVPSSSDGRLVLKKRDVQLFMKRLRKALHDIKIRFFCCGEYGDLNSRPHYHIVIYGWRPHDLIVHRYEGNYCVYRSPLIERLWTLGYSIIGDVNQFVGRYVARYVSKKMCDSFNEDYPEFSLYSKRNGSLGASYVREFADDFFRSGQAFIRDSRGYPVPMPLPSYYKRILRDLNPVRYSDFIERRKEFAIDGNACAEDLIASSHAFLTRNHHERYKVKV